MDLIGKSINNKFKVVQKISEGMMGTVWLAEEMDSGLNVAVKVLRNSTISNRVEDFIRFRNEVDVVAKLNIPYVVKVIDMGKLDNLHYIVMEYLEGKGLHALIEQKTILSIEEVVDIIYKVTEILKVVHQAGVTHRDLKPGNIIVNRVKDASKDAIWHVNLTGFGLSQIKEFNTNDTSKAIDLFNYTAPEKLGVIKKSVDGRSDLYSLGIIFYQLLTGRLPFEADSLNAIIHQQIAKIPPKLKRINPFITDTLENIVLKLLEKEPERRYQSADGLLKDLERYMRGQENFVLGLNDGGIKLNFKTELTGRTSELEELKKAFDSALAGQGSIVFISGEAGSGKTRLVEELKSYVYEKNGVFLQGKCFSGKNKIPYGPFKDVISEYVRDYNKEYSERKKEKIKESIRNDIGNLGEIILRLNPQMSEIIGECPPLVALDFAKESSRFLTVSSQLFYGIGKVGGGLAVLLDDLHWSDEGSVDLLVELAKEASVYPILFIGTYRSDEMHENQGLCRLINYLRDNLAFYEIHLKPFSQEENNLFISRLMFDQMDNVKEITNFIYGKSKGNPFFAVEILKQLVTEKAVFYEGEHWRSNEEVLEKVEVSSTILDAILKKISLLSEKEVAILSYAAVIGRKFDIEVLFRIGDLNKKEIVQAIDRAIELQLLQEDFKERGKVHFAHDRIKEAFYKNIEEKSKGKLHLEIAAAIETLYMEDKDRVIFDLAYHFIEGKDKGKILEYAFAAGEKAKINCAFEDAISYLSIIRKLLEENGRKDHEKWMLCMEKLGESYSDIGKPGKAIEIFSELLPFIKIKWKLARIYRLLSYAYFKISDWENCQENCKKALFALGEKLPENKFLFGFSVVKEMIMHFVHIGFPKITTPVKESGKYEETKECIWLYYILYSTCAMKGRKKLLRTVLRMLNLSESQLGKSKELALSTMMYALYLAEIPKFKPALKYYQKALALRKELNDSWGMANSYLNMGYFYKCKGEYLKSINCFKQNLDILKKIGGLSESWGSLSALAGTYINIGDYKNARVYNSKYCDMGIQYKNNFVFMIVGMFETMCLCEEGDLDHAEMKGLEANKLARRDNELFLTCITGIQLGRVYLEKGDILNAKKYLEECKVLFEENNFLKEYSIPLYPYLAETYLAEYIIIRDSLSTKDLKKLLKKTENITKDALENTKLWLTYRVCAIRTAAKLNELKGDIRKAENMFLECIKLSRDIRRKYELGLCHYEYAMFLRRLGKTEKAKRNFESAYFIFKEIGARGYERKTAGLLGIRDENVSSEERFVNEIRYSQRMSSIVSLTQDISSILSLDELLKKVISIAMEVTGAHKGYLMLKDMKNEEIEIKALEDIDGNSAINGYFSKSIVDEVLKTGQAVLTLDAMEDERYRNCQSVVYHKLKSILCTPVKYNNEIKGVCYLDNALSSAVFTEEDIDIMNIIMTQAAISIENARLYQLAVTDGLTGLYTHKHFMFLFDQELERARRYKKELSIVLFDIDNFKVFNDQFGHQAGDLVLADVAKNAQTCFRNIDIIGRYGGEEFILLLPETDQASALIGAERLRNAVYEMVVPFGGKELKVTISCGLATYPQHAPNRASLIKAADEALYTSKRNGKNRVTVFGA
ncbi:MAG: diguanylate cyclase [Clostridia bacterium]|nr:diguanylate cyclase [Clostridia bacterium]